jgi:hypothetical protein
MGRNVKPFFLKSNRSSDQIGASFARTVSTSSASSFGCGPVFVMCIAPERHVQQDIGRCLEEKTAPDPPSDSQFMRALQTNHRFETKIYWDFLWCPSIAADRPELFASIF